MLIGLVAGEGGGEGGGEGEEERESHSKVGTLLGPTNIESPFIKRIKITFFNT